MKIITCTLPNASTNINGVEFNETAKGMVSAPVDDAVAAGFTGIPGYAIADVKPAKASEVPKE